MVIAPRRDCESYSYAHLQHWVIRIPNFLKVETKPFHPDTYIGPDQEDEDGGSSAREKNLIKLKVENTLRWRWAKDEQGRDVSKASVCPFSNRALMTLHFHSAVSPMLASSNGPTEA